MSWFSFLVTGYAPAGVSLTEVADHLADASRLTAASYDASDPMARLGQIEVYGLTHSRDMASSSPLETEEIHLCPRRDLGRGLG